MLTILGLFIEDDGRWRLLTRGIVNLAWFWSEFGKCKSFLHDLPDTAERKDLMEIGICFSC